MGNLAKFKRLQNVKTLDKTTQQEIKGGFTEQCPPGMHWCEMSDPQGGFCAPVREMCPFSP